MSTYEDASLIFYPSGYKAGILECLKPTTGTGNLTFTRASTATRVNESGLIESVATGVPRIDFTSGCGKLLLEPQRANLVFPSATGATQTVTTTAQSYTLSFYGTGTVVRSGTSVGTLVGTGANNRVFVTFTATAGSLILTVTGSVTNWQVEAGAYPTSLIITTTSAVTRVAETAGKTGISALIGQTEGTLYFEGRTSAISSELCNINQSAINAIWFTTNSAGNIQCIIISDSVTFSISSTVSGISNNAKMAVRYKSNNFAFYVNGVLIGTNTTATWTPNTQFNKFQIAAGGWVGTFNQTLCQAAIIFPTAKSNAELATLTTL